MHVNIEVNVNRLHANSCKLFLHDRITNKSTIKVILCSFPGKLQDLYSKGHPYPSYPGYIMMTNMNNEPYMNNGSLSPPIPRTVSVTCSHSIPLTEPKSKLVLPKKLTTYSLRWPIGSLSVTNVVTHIWATIWGCFLYDLYAPPRRTKTKNNVVWTVALNRVRTQKLVTDAGCCFSCICPRRNDSINRPLVGGGMGKKIKDAGYASSCPL